MAEYIKMIAVSMIGATLFLGGYLWPCSLDPGALVLGPVYLFIKVAIWLFMMIWVRATLPRIRYDRLMALGLENHVPAGAAECRCHSGAACYW